MKKLAIAGAAVAAVLGLVGVIGGFRSVEAPGKPAEIAAEPTPPPTAQAIADSQQGFLYGRVTATNGTAYEGRLRFGGGEEAFWDDYFNGTKIENTWVSHVPP